MAFIGDQAVNAWVNFQGTGTVTIRDDRNVSSITDHGTGDYTVNFSTNFGNTNHATVLQGSGQTNGEHCVGFFHYIRNTYSASAVSMGFFRLNDSSRRADQTIVSVLVSGAF
jgi:hypothetical protein